MKQLIVFGCERCGAETKKSHRVRIRLCPECAKKASKERSADRCCGCGVTIWRDKKRSRFCINCQKAKKRVVRPSTSTEASEPADDFIFGEDTTLDPWPWEGPTHEWPVVLPFNTDGQLFS